MLKILWSKLHQSYFVVALAVGIITGTVLALVFRINYFASPVWIAVALMLLIWAFLVPRFAFLVIALIAGMILAFFRVSDELAGENYIKQFFNQEVVVEKHMPFSLVSDERFCDGLYYALSLRQINKFMKNPAILEKPLEKKEEDIK